MNSPGLPRTSPSLRARHMWFPPLPDPMPDCWERLCCHTSGPGYFDFAKRLKRTQLAKRPWLRLIGIERYTSGAKESRENDRESRRACPELVERGRLYGTHFASRS